MPPQAPQMMPGGWPMQSMPPQYPLAYITSQYAPPPPIPQPGHVENGLGVLQQVHTTLHNGTLFGATRGPIDWSAVASVDVDNIKRTGDVDTLQILLPNIVFGDLIAESGGISNRGNRMDPGFIKLMRLSQLMLEYLLRCQEVILEQLDESQNKLKTADIERIRLCDMLNQANTEIEQHKRAEVAYKRTAQAYALIGGPAQTQEGLARGGHTCPWCGKTFTTALFLESHTLRRHSNLDANGVPIDGVDDLSGRRASIGQTGVGIPEDQARKLQRAYERARGQAKVFEQSVMALSTQLRDKESMIDTLQNRVESLEVMLKSSGVDGVGYSPLNNNSEVDSLTDRLALAHARIQRYEDEEARTKQTIAEYKNKMDIVESDCAARVSLLQSDISSLEEALKASQQRVIELEMGARGPVYESVSLKNTPMTRGLHAGTTSSVESVRIVPVSLPSDTDALPPPDKQLPVPDPVQSPLSSSTTMSVLAPLSAKATSPKVVMSSPVSRPRGRFFESKVKEEKVEEKEEVVEVGVEEGEIVVVKEEEEVEEKEEEKEEEEEEEVEVEEEKEEVEEKEEEKEEEVVEPRERRTSSLPSLPSPLGKPESPIEDEDELYNFDDDFDDVPTKPLPVAPVRLMVSKPTLSSPLRHSRVPSYEEEEEESEEESEGSELEAVVGSFGGSGPPAVPQLSYFDRIMAQREATAKAMEVEKKRKEEEDRNRVEEEEESEDDDIDVDDILNPIPQEKMEEKVEEKIEEEEKVEVEEEVEEEAVKAVEEVEVEEELSDWDDEEDDDKMYTFEVTAPQPHADESFHWASSPKEPTVQGSEVKSSSVEPTNVVQSTLFDDDDSFDDDDLEEVITDLDDSLTMAGPPPPKAYNYSSEAGKPKMQSLRAGHRGPPPTYDHPFSTLTVAGAGAVCHHSVH